ncbi:MAG: hypothetical protein JWP62_3105 [Blastococcus sp.]|jgi:hypothetical protein|nr:hypothetical protein [Blastococcus sp.]
MRRYPSQRLREEVAFVAHHLHWSYRELMSMEHGERLVWVAQAARLAGPDGAPNAALDDGRWR